MRDERITPFVGYVNHCDVRVDRASPWGNPFHMGKWYTRAESILCFALYAACRWTNEELAPLKGKVLGCHCAPHRCHAEVLALAANGVRTLEELHDLAYEALMNRHRADLIRPAETLGIQGRKYAS